MLAHLIEEILHHGHGVLRYFRPVSLDMVLERRLLGLVMEPQVEWVFAGSVLQSAAEVGGIKVGGQVFSGVPIILERIDRIESRARAVRINKSEPLVRDAARDKVGQFLGLAREPTGNERAAGGKSEKHWIDGRITGALRRCFRCKAALGGGRGLALW